MSARSYRVGIIPHASYALAFGGMEVQQDATISALTEIGAEVVRFDIWARSLDVDLVHVFGSEYPHAEVIERLRAKGIPLVVTAMFMPERPMWVFQMLRKLDSYLPSTTYTLRNRSLMNASAVVTLSEREKQNTHDAFGVPLEKIHVIANGVEDRFFTATPNLFHERYSHRDFVLCVAAIDERKNQLHLAEAMVQCGLPTVFIGDPSTHGGTQTSEYAERFSKYVSAHPTLLWLRGIKHDDPLLASAFAASKVHVLVSTAEGQGLVSLEAAAAGSAIVVSDLPNLRELFGEGAFYAAPNSRSSIIRAVKKAYANGPDIASKSGQRPWLQSWREVAKQLDSLYKSVIEP